MKENSEKILVRYYSNVLEQETVETLWTEVIDRERGLYKIDNIPFYGPEFSCDDIIYAEFDEYEERLTFRKVVEPSGNSTIQIIVMDENMDVQKLRDEFRFIGCESEGTKSKYFVLDIPFEKNYKEICEKLSELTESGKIEFAEPVISGKHNAER
jgi:hypothetical protein